MNLLIYIIGALVFTISIVFGIKHIFSPKYKIVFDRAKFEDKLEMVEKIYALYIKNKSSSIKEPKCILNAKVNSYLGTDRYDYRVIFKIIEYNYNNIEGVAKNIDHAWPFLYKKNTDNEYDIQLTHRFTFNRILHLRNITFGIYVISSLIIILLMIFSLNESSHDPSKWISILIFILIIVIFFSAWIGSKLTALIVLERMIEKK